ncbi:hypothetical protein [Meiothermus sp. Pnk-1]|uniref:hypothetical protein n=1 Tax=Meiothermus sp. Pnk-1 TaxID=873128 RepID=UPI000D7C1A07|nr:hypothetical protein [Meiothermus sp. Pnk-1]PZA07416.1 hypothetical protein DNA98_07240 [Meiothermus sp. Pnk-1]
MQTGLKELFDRALAEGVQAMGERYGFGEADGAIVRPTLEAALEALPPPHRRFVQEYLDYYRRRFVVMGKEGAEAVLLVWSLEEPLVRALALNQVPDLERLPWGGRRPLREDFRDAPLLTPREALRQIAHILRAEGFTPREEPVLLRPESEELVAEVAARLRMVLQGRSLEETARRLVERNLACWEEEGESPQAVAVVDVGGPIPVLLAFDDPRPLVWEGAAA